MAYCMDENIPGQSSFDCVNIDQHPDNLLTEALLRGYNDILGE